MAQGHSPDLLALRQKLCQRRWRNANERTTLEKLKLHTG
jgi:hypothetical protein